MNYTVDFNWFLLPDWTKSYSECVVLILVVYVIEMLLWKEGRTDGVLFFIHFYDHLKELRNTG